MSGGEAEAAFAAAVGALLGRLGLPGGELPVKRSPSRQVSFVGEDLVLRLSGRSPEAELAAYRPLEGLPGVPGLVAAGPWEAGPGKTYVLLRRLPGLDCVAAAGALDEAGEAALGRDLARFLDELHERRGGTYDIGHYVPLVPAFAGGWAEGHAAYRAYLRRATEGLPLATADRGVLEEAFGFLESLRGALAHEEGPVLLHNDLHPKNIVVHEGMFSGVIDWECAQYGEPDFELCHLVHWLVFPPEPWAARPGILAALLEAGPRCARVPRLAERLAVYEVEHELAQLHWSGGSAAGTRIPRIRAWMEGAAERALAGAR